MDQQLMAGVKEKQAAVDVAEARVKEAKKKQVDLPLRVANEILKTFEERNKIPTKSENSPLITAEKAKGCRQR